MKLIITFLLRPVLTFLLTSTLMCLPASALCVINDSVLPLALLGPQNNPAPSGKRKKAYDPEKACEEEKRKETISSEWYRGNFHGLDND